MNAARNAPGDPRVADGAPTRERIACPKKNVTKLSSSQKMIVASAAIPDLRAQQEGPFGRCRKSRADRPARVLA
jgi:hypothetical protein